MSPGTVPWHGRCKRGVVQQGGVSHKDVTGADCGAKTFTEGQVIFDIYKKDGGNLLLGRSSFFLDGDSSDTRPVDLDVEHPLAKQ